MRTRILVTTLSILGLLQAGCSTESPGTREQVQASAAVDAAVQATTIPWFEGSVDEAFALARESDKPLFLYWGAEWCPYCKSLEANVFIREEFIRLSQQFVPLDMSNGDSALVKDRDRFKIHGFPTVIVFSPAGEELTRIPGGIDMEQYASVLELTLDQVRPVSALLAAALEGEPVDASDWQLLASYSWSQDRGQALGEEDPAQVMLDLLAAAPAEDGLTRGRLTMAALEVWLEQDDATRDASLAEIHLQGVEAILAAPALARDNLINLAAYGDDVVDLAEGERQARLQQALLALYEPVIEDAEQFNRLNRASVLSGWASTATALLEEDETLADDRITWASQHADELVAGLDAFQLHAGVNSLWGVYYRLGRIDAAKDTLALGIARSNAPYYFMSGMGILARRAGNDAEALDWFLKAWEATRTPIDRASWGSRYLRGLIQMAPDDTAEIERASASLFADLASQTDGMEVYERLIGNLRDELTAWSADHGERQRVVARLGDQMTATCAQLPPDDPGQITCARFLVTAEA